MTPIELKKVLKALEDLKLVPAMVHTATPESMVDLTAFHMERIRIIEETITQTEVKSFLNMFNN